MKDLGGYQQLALQARVLGSVIFVLALLVTSLLERLQLSLRASETKTWWASNGRDVLNAAAFGTLFLGLRVMGFEGPIALAIGAVLVVLISLIQGSLARFPRLSTAVSLTVSMALGLPVLVMPRLVNELFRAAIEWLS